MNSYAVVDSGTTTTRVRVWRDGRAAWSAACSIGARDTALDGNDRRLRQALAELLAALAEEAGERPEAAICSGMITSNMGLVEVPHLVAPAGTADLARALVRRELPDVAPMPFYFVPGVKTLPEEPGLASLPEADVLRGEEAECIGLQESLGLSGPVVYLHFGSHHKAVFVDGEGRILRSRTSITGELLSAVASGTILGSSLVPLSDVLLEPELWRAGLDAALAHGLGRALFLVRVGEQVAGRGRNEMTSYLLGALASLDLPLLSLASESATVVLYGAGSFPAILGPYLEEQGRKVVTVEERTAELASAVGAVRLYERHRRMVEEGTLQE